MSADPGPLAVTRKAGSAGRAPHAAMAPVARAGVLELVRDLLDHELLDPEGRPCGTVDDIELAGKAGSPLRVVGVVVGTSAWSARLPFGLGRVAKALLGRGQVRVPWSELRLEDGRIHLRQPSRSLGLASGERRFGRWLTRLPGA